MFCPKCGKDNSTGERFCRSCGLGLQAVSHAVTSQFSSDDAQRPRRFDVPIAYGFFMLCLGLAIIFIGNVLFHEQLIADIGSVIAFIGVAIFGYRGLQLLMSGPGGTTTVGTEPGILPKSDIPDQLNSAERFEGVPSSVTERTTRNLESAPINRKSE
jgi:hypothetical protein